MSQQRASTTGAYIAVTTLFFAWGFITSLVDPLVAAVKGIFTLDDVEAQFAAFAFFIAYGVMSFPAARLVSRRGSVPSILLALGTMIVGCLLMLFAANIAWFAIVLLGLFVLASGITILQVAANPLSAALGNPKYSHLRLTLSQMFNSFGTFLGPLIGAHLFLKGVEVKDGAVVTEAVRTEALAGIDMAYIWICGLIALLALFFFFARNIVSRAVPTSHAEAGDVGAVVRRAFGGPAGWGIGALALMFLATLWAGLLNAALAAWVGAAIALALLTLMARATGSGWAMFGAWAIFLYVGAEVAIGTQMALFLNSDAIWGHSNAPFGVPLLGAAMGSDGVPGVSLQEAGKAVAFYWGGAMVGRAVGSALLGFVRAPLLLAVFTAIAALMCGYVAMVGGVDAGFVALSIGLFNSIMFPVIFTLTLERSTASAEVTSGLLCTAIIGGAFLPLLVGTISQGHGYSFALILPALCYLFLMAFAVAAGRSAGIKSAGAVAGGH